MISPQPRDAPTQPIDPVPGRLAKDVVPVSIADALRTLVRELTGTAKAYARMIEWPKDVSWKQVTLASLDRIGFAIVGVAVAVARRGRRRGGRAPRAPLGGG
ncbi:MAG: hypothetical protein U0610_02465 [bacterium]